MPAQTNADYVRTFALTKKSDGTPFDLTGLSLKMQLKRLRNGPVALEASTDNGRLIVLAPTTGNVTLSLPRVLMQTLKPDNYFYDCVSPINDSSTQFVFKGILPVSSGVTDDQMPYPPSDGEITIEVDDNSPFSVALTDIDFLAALAEMVALAAQALASANASEASREASDADLAGVQVAAVQVAANKTATDNNVIVSNADVVLTSNFAAAAQVAGPVYTTVALGNAAVADGVQFRVARASDDGVDVWQRASSDPLNAVLITSIVGPATVVAIQAEAGVDAPFPALPAKYLHWTPRRIITDSVGYAVRYECDQGTLVASAGGYIVATPDVSGVEPLPRRLDSQSISGVLPVDGTQDISIAGLPRVDDFALDASIDDVFTHSNITAHTGTSDSVSISGSFVTAGRTWRVYSNNRLAFFPPKTDLLVVWVGQSWSVTSTDSDPARPALSLVPMYPGQVLMPSRGVHLGTTEDGGDGTSPIHFNSYADLVEISATTVGGIGESPASSCANHLMRDFNLFYGASHDVRLVSINVAHGGWELERFMPGTKMFKLFKSGIRDFVDTSLSQGRTPLVLAVCWTHGQANDANKSPVPYYMNVYRAIRKAQIDTIRSMVPNQYFDPAFVIDVLRSATNNRNAFDPIVYAQSLLAYEPGFVSAGEQYTTPGSIAGGIGHPTSWGATLIGHRHARAIERSPPLGYGWTPLQPDLTRGMNGVRWTAANKFEVYFSLPLGRGTLAADTSGVDIGLGSACDATNWGFYYWDNSGGSDSAVPTVAISASAIKGTDRIEFTLSGTPTGYNRKLICAGLKDGAGDDALHGGGRCLVYCNDSDTRWNTSLYPIPVNEGGDGVTPKLNRLWMKPFELQLGVAS